MKLAVVALVAAWGVVQASEPGQPLGCSDWVVTEPGISCRFVAECGVEGNTLPFPCDGLDGASTDAEGRIIGWELTEPFRCGVAPLSRYDIRVFDGGTNESIAYVNARCTADYWDEIQPFARAFDASHGRLFVWFTSRSHNSPQSYAPRRWLAAFEGFTTTFDVLQTFTPPALLGFRVPYMPEGLPAADHFDTYYGPLTKPIDFGQAQGLRCDYPASPPAIGAYLEVADTVPTPALGQGVYYVTAVTHQGQTRYGRKASGGELMGRELAGLAACAKENQRGEE